jgi:hypothetical protein
VTVANLVKKPDTVEVANNLKVGSSFLLQFMKFLVGLTLTFFFTLCYLL